MLQDALYAWLHYLAIFFLIVILTAQAVLLRPGLGEEIVRRLAIYDRLYLLSAVMVLVTGMLRLSLGAKGMAFYASNPWFHAKMTLFVLTGLCSIIPTLAFLRWRKQSRTVPAYMPPNEEIARARRWVMIEVHMLVLLPLCAVLMARGVGM
ncbi:putative inner membrane protein [plant metagenome]|uniref:Putative inner membrane protein n=1 Tax=plant metagenome TaxID=1297885 RepID=A0A484RL28_9ZZZZ